MQVDAPGIEGERRSTLRLPAERVEGEISRSLVIDVSESGYFSGLALDSGTDLGTDRGADRD